MDSSSLTGYLKEGVKKMRRFTPEPSLSKGRFPFPMGEGYLTGTGRVTREALNRFRNPCQNVTIPARTEEVP